MKPRAATDRNQAWQRLVALVMDSRWDWRRRMTDAAGLPFSRVRALDRLQHGPLTLSALAEVIGADPPATTVIVNDLEARGLVLREVHPGDRRVKTVSLTTEGRRVMRAARSVTERAPESFSALSDQDVAALDRIVTRLTPPSSQV